MSNSILAIGIVAIIAVCAIGGGIAIATTDTNDYASEYETTSSPVHDVDNSEKVVYAFAGEVAEAVAHGEANLPVKRPINL